VPLNLNTTQVLAATQDAGKVFIKLSDETGQILQMPQAKAVAPPIKHDVRLLAAGFSCDGRTLLTGGHDQRIRIWDATTGKPVREPIKATGIIRAVAYSHDGALILSGSSDQSARLWDAQTGAPQGEPMRHPTEVVKVVFSPDDRLALAIGSDHQARLWDVGTCQLLARPLQYEFGWNQANLEIRDGVFESDGSKIVFDCRDGTTRLYRVPPQLHDDERFIHAWAAAHCAFRVDRSGIPRQLSQAEWLEAKRTLAGLESSR
jgi:eukaryotic-like serine/threonine-protein kinase